MDYELELERLERLALLDTILSTPSVMTNAELRRKAEASFAATLRGPNAPTVGPTAEHS